MAGIKNEDEKRRVMEEVIDGCIEDGILSKFLKERREEVIMASILEYDQAAHEAAIREDGYEEGRKEGRDEERVNTEAERKRADAAMAELERYKKKYGELAET